MTWIRFSNSKGHWFQINHGNTQVPLPQTLMPLLWILLPTPLLLSLHLIWSHHPSHLRLTKNRTKSPEWNENLSLTQLKKQPPNALLQLITRKKTLPPKRFGGKFGLPTRRRKWKAISQLPIFSPLAPLAILCLPNGGRNLLPLLPPLRTGIFFRIFSLLHFSKIVLGLFPFPFYKLELFQYL